MNKPIQHADVITPEALRKVHDTPQMQYLAQPIPLHPDVFNRAVELGIISETDERFIKSERVPMISESNDG